MKKQFLTVAVAALALAGCSKNETVEVASNRAIGFESFVGKATRAVINGAGDLTSFNVFGGYSSLTNNFNDVVVTKGEGEGEWTYGNTQYWEASKTYTFQAYAGAEATAKATNNGVEFTGFVATGDKDLLAADVVSVQTGEDSAPTSGVVGGKVQFNFRHVLSMIKFTFESTLAENVKITITDLQVKNLNRKGNYNPAASNTGTWEDLSENTTPYDLNVDGVFDSKATKESTEVIVLPQNIAADAIEVTFTLNATGGLTVTNAQHTVKLPAILWEEGNRYNYNAKITIDNIDPQNPNFKPIEFGDPKVDGWQPAKGGEILPQE